MRLWIFRPSLRSIHRNNLTNFLVRSLRKAVATDPLAQMRCNGEVKQLVPTAMLAYLYGTSTMQAFI